MPAATGGSGTAPLNVIIRISTTGVGAAAGGMRTVTGAAAKMTRGLGTGVITARTLGDSMRMTASLMKYTVAGGFMKMGQAAIQAYRNFELSFSRIRGLVGISADSVEEMKRGVLDMAGATTRGPEELAEALYFITSAGLRDASVAMSVLESSAKAAAAGMGDTKTVADAVTSAMNAYGPAMLGAGTATNILVAAVREGKAEADTFAPAFSKVLPVSAAFGASFNDVAAAMAALTRSGMTAGTAAIYVRQTLSQLLKPSKQGADMLRSVGTSAEQVREEIQNKGLFVGLKNLSDRLGGTEEGAEAFAKVFGNVRALTAMLQLVGPAAEENEEIFRRMQNTTGDLDHAFRSYADTVDAKFNKSFADSRVALIKLGQTLKPFISTILDVGAFFARVAGSVIDFINKFGPLGKIIVTVAGVLTVFVIGLAAAMTTTSSLIRIFGNLFITLTGVSIQYDATTRSLYRYTGATAAATGATSTHAATTGAAALTAAGYTKMNIGLKASFVFLKNAVVKATKAMVTFIMANPLLVAGMVAAAAAAATFFYFWNRSSDNAKKSTANMVAQLGKVNEILDQTIQYGQIKIGFQIETDIEAANQLQKDMDRVREQLEQQAPDLMPALSALGETNRSAQVAAVKAAMESQFATLGEGPKKALLAVFQKDLNISPEEYAAAVVGNVSGDPVTDALIQIGVSAAAGASKQVSDVMTKQGGETLQTYISALTSAQKIDVGGNLQFADDSINKSLTAMGKGFTDFIQTSNGDLTPLIITMQELDAAGINSADTFQNVVGTALKGLTGNLDLADESAGNFYKIFMDDSNEATGKLRQFVQQTTKLQDLGAADNAVKAIRTEMEKLPKAQQNAKNGFNVVMGVLNKYMIVQKDSSGLTKEQLAAFEGEREAIRGVMSAYEDATNEIKRYEDAQRSLRGVTQTQEETLRDVYDSYDNLGDAVKDAGGSFSIQTENGRNAREELQKSGEALFDYANALATTDPEAAGLAVVRGLENIVNAARQTGGEVAAIDAANLLSELGFTSQNFVDSIKVSSDAADAAAYDTGKAVTDGIAKGISDNESNMSQALVNALNNVIVVAKKDLQSSSPSRKTARLLGLPMAQGIYKGFEDEMKSSRFRNGMSKNLDNVITSMAKSSGYKAVGKYMASFLEKKKDVETPAQDFVKATIGRMKDIIGSLGNYIKSQLSFRDAQSNLAKLINMQRSYDDQRRKAARDVQFAETRFGARGGAEVTGYEQAQIDELQLQFERVSRDYAMGRATYVELVDAEIALYEARAAASETSQDVIGAQNEFIDKTVQAENRTLELASAIVSVQEAYLDVQEAAAELYMNHKELAGVYNSLATATGIASGEIVVGSKNLSTLGTDVSTLGGYSSTVGGYVSTLGNNIGITGQALNTTFYGEGGIFKALTDTGANVSTLTTSIGAKFTNLSKGLLDPESEMAKNLRGLGPAIAQAIEYGANEMFAKSPLQLRIPVTAIIDTKGGGGGGTPPPGTQPLTDPSSTTNTVRTRPTARVVGYQARAVGGSVNPDTPYMVGELGPELFVPKVNGTIVGVSALDRYTRTRQSPTKDARSESGNNINVVVNNPVPAAAEDSITRRMKVLANSGLFG